MWVPRRDYLELTVVERRAFADEHNSKVKAQNRAKGG